VPTGIHQSERNRPADKSAAKASLSQRVGQAALDKAVISGKVSATEVAQKVFDAMVQNQFYIYSHPQALDAVKTRLEDILQARNPSDPRAQAGAGCGLEAGPSHGLIEFEFDCRPFGAIFFVTAFCV